MFNKIKEKISRRNNHIVIICMATIFIASISVCGCEKKNDRSENIFSTIHFNGANQSERTLSATNGSDIFYVNGSCIYKFGEPKSVLDVKEKIRSLTVSSQNLYVVYNDNSYDIFNISSMTVSEGRIENVINLIADNNIVFGETNANNGLFYFYEDSPENIVSLSDIICSGTPMGITDGHADTHLAKIDNTYLYSDVWTKNGEASTSGIMMAVIVNGQPKGMEEYHVRNQPLYFYGDALYYISCGGGFVLKSDGTEEKLPDIKSNSYIDSICDKFFDGETVYELLKITNKSSGHTTHYYNCAQSCILCDCIMANNLKDKSSSVYYKTKNNLTRIIGFDGELIYLFDVQNNSISSYDKKSDITVELKKLDKSALDLEELKFEWCGNVLFIYDRKNKLVDHLTK